MVKKKQVKNNSYSSPNPTYTSKNKSRSFAGLGAVTTLIFALFLFVVVFAKITDKPYVGLAYWLEVFEDMPVMFNLNELFNVIQPVDLPDWLRFAEIPLNFLLEIINLFVGLVRLLLNVLDMLKYFIAEFFFGAG